MFESKVRFADAFKGPKLGQTEAQTVTQCANKSLAKNGPGPTAPKPTAQRPGRGSGLAQVALKGQNPSLKASHVGFATTRVSYMWIFHGFFRMSLLNQVSSWEHIRSQALKGLVFGSNPRPALLAVWNSDDSDVGVVFYFLQGWIGLAIFFKKSCKKDLCHRLRSYFVFTSNFVQPDWCPGQQLFWPLVCSQPSSNKRSKIQCLSLPLRFTF